MCMRGEEKFNNTLNKLIRILTKILVSRNHAAHFVLSSALASSQRKQNRAQGEKEKGHWGGEGREREAYCRCCC